MEFATIMPINTLPTVTLVTGFAGSGTSRIAEFLHKHRGIPMSTLLMAPPTGYPKAYFDWEDFAWVMGCGIETLKNHTPGAYLDYIDFRSKEHSVWGVKSPLLVPFLTIWKQALVGRGFEVKVIQAIRPYEECKLSLKRNLPPDSASTLCAWNSSYRHIYENMLPDVAVPYGSDLEEIL